ncbi:hypothetical protein Tco_1554576 [Tanacetum coccineum]
MTVGGGKNLLNLRYLVRENIVHQIGNGDNISMWFDNWSAIGPLCNIITYRDLYDARLNASVSVRDLVLNNRWNWPENWNEMSPQITSMANPQVDDNAFDKIMWKSIDGRTYAFSTKQAYYDMSIQWPKDEESHNHLFFDCDFSQNIWNGICKMIKMNNSHKDWECTIVDFAAKPNANSIWSVVRRLSIAATVYLIWKERNHRIFRDELRTSAMVFNSIVDTIRLKLKSLKVKDTVAVKDVERMADILD